jgi:hypothetical protein
MHLSCGSAEVPRKRILRKLDSLLAQNDGLGFRPWVRDQAASVETVQGVPVEALPSPCDAMVGERFEMQQASSAIASTAEHDVNAEHDELKLRRWE